MSSGVNSAALIEVLKANKGADDFIQHKEWDQAWEDFQNKCPETEHIRDEFTELIWRAVGIPLERLVEAVQAFPQMAGAFEAHVQKVGDSYSGSDNKINYSEWLGIWEDMQLSFPELQRTDDKFALKVWNAIKVTLNELLQAVEENWADSTSYLVQKRLVIDMFQTEASIGPPSLADVSITEALQTASGLLARDDWGGPLVARPSSTRDIALKIVRNAKAIADGIDLNADKADDQMTPKLEIMFETQDKNQIISEFYKVATRCREYLQIQESLVEVLAPCKIFGDIHGQFRDLLLLFRMFGFPTHMGGDVESVSYVFDGDWVDRGAHQLECIALLFSLKALYPERIWLIRGNHEFRSQNEHLGPQGYLAKCNSMFPPPTVPVYPPTVNEDRPPMWATPNPEQLAREGPFYSMSHEVFAWLPLAAVVEGSIFVVHGGIGGYRKGAASSEAGNFVLQDVRKIKRPIQDEEARSDPLLWNLLWSDPEEADDEMAMGVHTSDRDNHEGFTTKFAGDVTQRFCAANGLSMVVRGHQMAVQGFKVLHEGRLVTLFSARNYDASHPNDGSLLLVAPDAAGRLRVRAKTLTKRR